MARSLERNGEMGSSGQQSAGKNSEGNVSICGEKNRRANREGI